MADKMTKWNTSKFPYFKNKKVQSHPNEICSSSLLIVSKLSWKFFNLIPSQITIQNFIWAWILGVVITTLVSKVCLLVALSKMCLFCAVLIALCSFKGVIPLYPERTVGKSRMTVGKSEMTVGKSRDDGR